ncbi:MAG: NUDIX domain-containing protein [Anaerolineae bacterium]|nr:NUDIX domain-containing protein [Anaerolineae bacterium]
MFYIVNVEGAIWHEGRYLAAVRGAAETHAAGALGFVGGKVEGIAWKEDAVLEQTLRREIREEVGLEVDEISYVCSSMFTAGDLEPVINIVFLCRYRGGTLSIDDPGEVASAEWLTPQALHDDPRTPPWTRTYLEQIEQVRVRLGW